VKLDGARKTIVQLGKEISMTIHVAIPDPLAAKVARAAKTQGKSPEDVVLEAVAERVDPLSRLNLLLTPVRQAFEESRLTEDEAVDLFEAEKHAMRAERQTGKP
jgi:hypothetical protein